MRIIIIFVFPLLYSSWLFSNQQLPIEYNTENDKIVFLADTSKLTEPSMRNSLRKLFSVPFSLDNYNVCIYHGKSKIVYSNNKSDEILNAEIIFKNITLDIPKNTERCILLRFDENVTFRIRYTASINFEKQFSKEIVKQTGIASMVISFDHPSNQMIHLLDAQPLSSNIEGSMFIYDRKINFKPDIRLDVRYLPLERILLVLLSMLSLIGTILLITSALGFVRKE